MNMLRALICLSLVGCWADEELVDGTFTREQWDFMQGFRLPPPEFCPSDPAIANCAAAASLGQLLFFEKKLSGPITISDPLALGPKDATGMIACASCHSPGDPDDDTKAQYFTDTRSQPGNISIGAAYTGHNALSLVNVGFKAVVVAEKNCSDTDFYCKRGFSWNGRYDNAANVLVLAGLKGAAMNSTQQRMADVIRNDVAYSFAYSTAFGSTPGTDSEVFDNLALAFEAYFRKLISLNSPFDRYLAGTLDGQTTSARDALTEEQRRGLAVFIGKGMCVECHRGPLLSDLEFHNTSVPQRGVHVPDIDLGLAKTPLDEMRPPEPENTGKFLTQPLRNVAKTGPYMHAGQFATLADVIDFYRQGGGTEGFSGVKDPRIQPLEIGDDEARDLEAFLRALTGEPVAKGLRRPN